LKFVTNTEAKFETHGIKVSRCSQYLRLQLQIIIGNVSKITAQACEFEQSKTEGAHFDCNREFLTGYPRNILESEGYNSSTVTVLPHGCKTFPPVLEM